MVVRAAKPHTPPLAALVKRFLGGCAYKLALPIIGSKPSKAQELQEIEALLDQIGEIR